MAMSLVSGTHPFEKCSLITPCKEGDVPLIERGNDHNVPLGTKPNLLYTPRTARAFSVLAELVGERTRAAPHGGPAKLKAEARADPDSELLWSVPTARSDRAYNWGDSAIAPDAVGQMTAEGLRIPFYFEYELRARHPQGVIARLDPYESYYWSNEHKDDQPPFPTTLFVVDTEDVEDTYVRTAARMSRMSLPIFVSCRAALSNTGILGPSWHPLWEPDSPRLGLSDLRAYQWNSLYHRMRPVGGDT